MHVLKLRALVYKVHHVVIFAIAQISCYQCEAAYDPVSVCLSDAGSLYGWNCFFAYKTSTFPSTCATLCFSEIGISPKMIYPK